MLLTDYEKALLDGVHGEARQMAMHVLYDLGLYYGVDRFVEIVACHDDSTVYFGEAQVAFAEHLVTLGARFAVPTSTNACSLDMERWNAQRHDVECMSATRRIESSHLDLGAIASWTCAPYQAGFSPAFGQQVACAESNVIAYVNSILGARTNRYAGPLELLAGIAGRVPYFGLHKPENRKAQGLIVLDKAITPDMFGDKTLFNLIAYAYGSLVGDRVWALEGMPSSISMDDLKQFSATAASSGGIALFHLVGVTPEAQNREMAFAAPPQEVLTLTLDHVRAAEAALCNLEHDGDIDFISLGCPHFSCAEFQELHAAFAGRRVSPNTTFWVFTGRSTYRTVQDSGLLDAVKRLGVHVFVDGCTMEYPTAKWGTRSIMTNSGKFATYCFNKLGIHPVFGSLHECVETSVTGRVARRNKPWSN